MMEVEGTKYDNLRVDKLAGTPTRIQLAAVASAANWEKYVGNRLMD